MCVRVCACVSLPLQPAIVIFRSFVPCHSVSNDLVFVCGKLLLMAMVCMRMSVSMSLNGILLNMLDLIIK